VLGYVLASALSSASLFAYVSSSPTILIETYHVPAQAFGWIFGLNGAGIIGAGQLNRVLAHRYPPRAILQVANLVACGCSMLMLAAALTGFGGAVGVLVPLWFVLASYGLAQPNATAAAMHAGGARSGAASAVFGFMQSGSGALAAAVAAALHDGTARPMAGVIALCLAAAAVALTLTRKAEPTSAASA
jgi:DHA1 family bicyclomycin/chloramphenicol resistance-like MFS transporter